MARRMDGAAAAWATCLNGYRDVYAKEVLEKEGSLWKWLGKK